MLEIKSKEEIYEEIKTDIESNTKLSNFNIGSVINSIILAISKVISIIYYFIKDAVDEAFISTATGEYLDNKADDFGLTRKSAIKSTGYVTFFRLVASPDRINIPKGTIVTTQAPDFIEFVTIEDAILLENTSSIDVQVECNTAGSIGNVAADSIKLLSSPITGIDGVTNNSAFTDGVDEETDDELRQRLKDFFEVTKMGTVGWYEQTALNVAGVSDVKVVENARGVGSVDVYIAGPDNTIPSDSLITEVENTLIEDKILGIDVRAFKPTELLVDITATIEIYTSSDKDKPTLINEATEAITEFINSIGIGATSIEGEINMSKISSIIISIEGIKNVTITSSDILVSEFELPIANNINIT